jgi:formiminotetrahydrofolate cyclodeaminase
MGRDIPSPAGILLDSEPGVKHVQAAVCPRNAHSWISGPHAILSQALVYKRGNLTIVIHIESSFRYNEGVSESWDGFDNWLSRLATEPLPGGVAAAALAAAMGAALVAKVSRLNLIQGEMVDLDRDRWRTALDVAQVHQTDLRSLVGTDEEAYRAVLKTKALPVQSPLRKQAWQAATEVPIHVAEACHQLLHKVAGILAICEPALRVDYQVGCWLLANGLDAGLAAAEANLRAWGDAAEAQVLKSRMEALQEDRID